MHNFLADSIMELNALLKGRWMQILILVSMIVVLVAQFAVLDRIEKLSVRQSELEMFVIFGTEIEPIEVYVEPNEVAI